MRPEPHVSLGPLAYTAPARRNSATPDGSRHTAAIPSPATTMALLAPTIQMRACRLHEVAANYGEQDREAREE